MNFETALKTMKQGFEVFRHGWNGKKLRVCHVTECNLCFANHDRDYDTYIDELFIIINYDNMKVNTWVPSVSDLCANDWDTNYEYPMEADICIR